MDTRDILRQRLALMRSMVEESGKITQMTSGMTRGTQKVSSEAPAPQRESELKPATDIFSPPETPATVSETFQGESCDPRGIAPAAEIAPFRQPSPSLSLNHDLTPMSLKTVKFVPVKRRKRPQKTYGQDFTEFMERIRNERRIFRDFERDFPKSFRLKNGTLAQQRIVLFCLG